MTSDILDWLPLDSSSLRAAARLPGKRRLVGAISAKICELLKIFKLKGKAVRTFNWIIHGFCGPGRGLKELRELAASDNACSILDATRDAA